MRCPGGKSVFSLEIATYVRRRVEIKKRKWNLHGARVSALALGDRRRRAGEREVLVLPALVRGDGHEVGPQDGAGQDGRHHHVGRDLGVEHDLGDDGVLAVDLADLVQRGDAVLDAHEAVEHLGALLADHERLDVDPVGAGDVLDLRRRLLGVPEVEAAGGRQVDAAAVGGEDVVRLEAVDVHGLPLVGRGLLTPDVDGGGVEHALGVERVQGGDAVHVGVLELDRGPGDLDLDLELAGGGEEQQLHAAVRAHADVVEGDDGLALGLVVVGRRLQVHAVEGGQVPVAGDHGDLGVGVREDAGDRRQGVFGGVRTFDVDVDGADLRLGRFGLLHSEHGGAAEGGEEASGISDRGGGGGQDQSVHRIRSHISGWLPLAGGQSVRGPVALFPFDP